MGRLGRKPPEGHNDRILSKDDAGAGIDLRNRPPARPAGSVRWLYQDPNLDVAEIEGKTVAIRPQGGLNGRGS